MNPMHATPTTYGPLKTDITKACPADMPKSERDEKCKLSLIFDFDVYSHITILSQSYSMLNNHLVFIHIGFSLVEAIFGTEGLQVLSAAKTVIDPSNIFTCDYCVRALPVSILCLYKLYPHFKVLLD